MRSSPILALALLLAACGSSTPELAHSGPRVQASLAAVWPVSAPARQAAFSRDGSLLATSDASGAITIRSTRDWKTLQRLIHPGGATTLAFSKDGTRLFTAGYDGNVREWNWARRSLAQVFNGQGSTIWTLDLAPDGERLATGGEDKIIRIWDIDRPGKAQMLRGHARNIWEVRFSPDGKRMASASFDDTIRLWDPVAGKLLKTLKGHTQAVVGLDFSPDGKLIATGGDDSTIRYWRASDGSAQRVVDNGRHVDKVAFSPNGQWLATGGHPHGMMGELWHQLSGSGSEGDAVKIWRVADGALVAGLPHPDDVYWVAFSRDGQWLVTSGEDSRFRLWRLRPVAR